MDVAVRQHVVVEAGALEDEEGSGEAVRRVGGPGREQVSTVGGHRQIGVMGALPHERE